jgi:serine/threonine-protein kinase
VNRRLAALGLLAGLGFLLYIVIDIGSGAIAGAPGSEDIILNGVGASVSLALLFLARLSRIPGSNLIDVALIYEVVIAAVISLAEAITDREAGQPIWGISWVCLFIVVFPVLVPVRLLPGAAASFLAAASGPVAYFVVAAVERRPPLASDLINFYAPNVIAFVLSVGIIALLARLGRELRKARELGSYRLVEKIGSGGMGEVWRAEHSMLAHPAAIKLLHPDRMSSGENLSQLMERFRREAQATANLSSAHTITLFDYGVTNAGLPYYVMELLDGIDLQTLVQEFGALEEERVALILNGICLSLSEAHEAGLIHRDVKPANVFVCRKGTETDFVKVLDFGLVKPLEVDRTPLTRDFAMTGTPAYMAPEVLEGGTFSPASDVYSLGCLAYCLLAGRPPFRGDAPMNIALAHLREPPDPLSRHREISPELERLILACLAKRPQDRPSGCRDIVQSLEGIRWPRPWNRERSDRWWEVNFPRPRRSS